MYMCVCVCLFVSQGERDARGDRWTGGGWAASTVSCTAERVGARERWKDTGKRKREAERAGRGGRLQRASQGGCRGDEGALGLTSVSLCPAGSPTGPWSSLAFTRYCHHQCSMVYGITRGGSVGGRILRNGRAFVLQYGRLCRRGGGIHG